MEISTPPQPAPELVSQHLQSYNLLDVTLWKKELQSWSSGNVKLRDLRFHWLCPGMTGGGADSTT